MKKEGKIKHVGFSFHDTPEVLDQILTEYPEFEVVQIQLNYLDFDALGIANLYRNRWQIETFFKRIKGNLAIRTLWGHSENAVKIHLWVAICTYLLVAIIKAKCNSQYSITEVEMLLRVSALERINIRELLTKPI